VLGRRVQESFLFLPNYEGCGFQDGKCYTMGESGAWLRYAIYVMRHSIENGKWLVKDFKIAFGEMMWQWGFERFYGFAVGVLEDFCKGVCCLGKREFCFHVRRYAHVLCDIN